MDSKIRLPTIETCVWRTVLDVNANCGILSTLFGRVDERATVVRDTCKACCESFPPTPALLNPVLASNLYRSLHDMSEGPSGGGLAPSRLEQLLSLAVRGLRLVEADALPLDPDSVHCNCDDLASQEQLPAIATSGSPLSERQLCASETRGVCHVCGRRRRRERVSRGLKLAEMVPPLNPSGRVRIWSVGVTTAPRRDMTLGLTLESIVHAGWCDPHLFLDGSVRVPPAFAHLTTTWREQPVGACMAWWMALAQLVATQSEADAYVLFQDDVDLYRADSLRLYLESALWPDGKPCIVSLYNPGLMNSCGWFPIPRQWDWGTLAVVFPKSLAHDFLGDPIVMRRVLSSSVEKHRPIPELLSEWIRRCDVPVWFTSPSLVQHTGSSSTIHMMSTLSHHRRSPWCAQDVEHARPSEIDLAAFPESAFPCIDQYEETYRKRVELGTNRMRDMRAVICGIGRDVRIHLPRTSARIERLGEMFSAYQVVVFENDSVDSTKEFLEDWSLCNSNVTVLSEQLHAPKYPEARLRKRAEALAMYRSRYVDFVRSQFSCFSHVIVVDLDLVGGWSYEGVANTFGYDDWDAVGSNGLEFKSVPPQGTPVRFFYDTWAYVPIEVCEGAQRHSEAFAQVRSLNLRRGMPLVPVHSSFGGMCVYRMECLLQCDYGGDDCEHVVLHRRMRDNGMGRIFVNPSQIAIRSALVH